MRLGTQGRLFGTSGGSVVEGMEGQRERERREREREKRETVCKLSLLTIRCTTWQPQN